MAIVGFVTSIIQNKSQKSKNDIFKKIKNKTLWCVEAQQTTRL